MAAHLVTCRICKLKFDLNKTNPEDWIQYKPKFYAHTSCYEKQVKTEKEKDEKLKKITSKRHWVKCPICGETFDEASTQSVKIMNNTRWAHATCWNNASQSIKNEIEFEQKTMDFISEIYGTNANWKLIKQQLEGLKLDPKYTWSAIYRTLYYFYKIKGNSPDDSNGGIGIIEYVYQDAWKYYYNIWLAQERNKEKDIKKYQPEVIEITIPEPQLKPKRRKVFTFLDEEVNE